MLRCLFGQIIGLLAFDRHQLLRRTNNDVLASHENGTEQVHSHWLTSYVSSNANRKVVRRQKSQTFYKRNMQRLMTGRWCINKTCGYT